MKKILVIMFLGLFYFGSANSVTVDLSVKISGSAGADKWVCISNPNQLDQEMLETLGLR